MRLRTRLAVLGGIGALVVLMTAAVLVVTTRTVEVELAKNEAAVSILNRVVNIRYLTQEYALQNEQRTLTQYKQEDASLNALLGDLMPSAGPGGETLARLVRTNQIVGTLFAELVANYATNHSIGRDPEVMRELERRLRAQIVIRVENMVADALALSNQSRQRVLYAQRRETVAVAVFGGVILILLALSTWVAIRHVLRPLARLEVGAAVVGSGDIDYRLDDTRRDEIGDLARAFNDMTDKLRRRDAKIRRLVDSNIIGIVISDLEGKALEANDAFLALLGYDRRDLQSGRLDWTTMLPPDLRQSSRDAHEELTSKGAYVPFETEYLHKDGRRIPVLIGGALLEGSPACSVAFLLDLSERKRVQEALARTQAELTRTARLTTLGALTASIAHEVNQPLSGIITNASTCLRMLAAEPPNIDGARETARRTIRDGHRASDVVTRLRLLFARKRNAGESVDLNLAVKEVAALLEGDMQRSRVILEQELDDDLPAVNGDRVQLQQVIVNLFRNATEAMNGVVDRPRLLRVRTMLGEDDRVRLTVRDTGIGIGSEGVERIFDAFYTTKDDGMGIGLSVSRSIIESHHGHLWAEPNDGPGATFAFSIPCTSESIADPVAFAAMRAPAVLNGAGLGVS